MLTEHWDEMVIGTVGFSLIEPLDANPRHLSSLSNLLLTDDCNVIFSTASRHACPAADAGIQIDGHSPSVFRMRVLRIHLKRFGPRLRI